MPTSVQAVAVLALFVLPGAVATFAFERITAGTTVRTRQREFGERVIVFLTATVVLFPAAAGFASFAWSNLLHVRRASGPGTATYVNDLSDGTSSFWWLFAPWVFYGLAALAGALAGVGWLQWISRGDDASSYRRRLSPQLRAWDWAFLEPGSKLIAVHLKSGAVVAGLYGEKSFASSIRSEHEQLYLERRLVVDRDGRILLNPNGLPVEHADAGAILVHAEDVEFLDVRRI